MDKDFENSRDRGHSSSSRHYSTSSANYYPPSSANYRSSSAHHSGSYRSGNATSSRGGRPIGLVDHYRRRPERMDGPRSSSYYRSGSSSRFYRESFGGGGGGFGSHASSSGSSTADPSKHDDVPKQMQQLEEPPPQRNTPPLQNQPDLGQGICLPLGHEQAESSITAALPFRGITTDRGPSSYCPKESVAAEGGVHDVGAVAVGAGDVETASTAPMAGLESIEEDDIDPRSSDANSSSDEHYDEYSEMDDPGSSASGTNRETSVTDSDSSMVTHMLNTYQRQAVDGIMTELVPFLSERFGVRSRPAAASSPNGTASGQSEGQQGQQGGEEQPGGGGGNGNAGDPSKTRKSSAGGDGNEERGLKAGNTSPRKLACPYFKHNPTGHGVARSCAGPGWETIHRVKEHIYRTHSQPRHCLRCGETFSVQRELAAHQRSSQTCELRLFDPPEGFTPEQERALKRKRRAACPEAEKWRHVFKILFPDVAEADIPSPYYENDNWGGLDRYDRYNEQELPRAIRRRLEQAATAFSGPLENHLRSQLDRIIREALSETSAQYRSSQNPSEPTVASPGVGTDDATTASALENSGSPNLFNGTIPELNFSNHDLEIISGNGDLGPTVPSGYMDPFTNYIAPGTLPREQNPEHPPFWADSSSMQEFFDILELPPAVENGGEAGWHPTDDWLNDTEERLNL